MLVNKVDQDPQLHGMSILAACQWGGRESRIDVTVINTQSALGSWMMTVVGKAEARGRGYTSSNRDDCTDLRETRATGGRAGQVDWL